MGAVSDADRGSQLARVRAGIVQALDDADIGVQASPYVPTGDLGGSATVFVHVTGDTTRNTIYGFTSVDLDVVLWVPPTEDRTGQERLDALIVGPASVRAALTHDLTFGGAAIDGALAPEAQASSLDLGGVNGWTYVWRLTVTLDNESVQ